MFTHKSIRRTTQILPGLPSAERQARRKTLWANGWTLGPPVPIAAMSARTKPSPENGEREINT